MELVVILCIAFTIVVSTIFGYGVTTRDFWTVHLPVAIGTGLLLILLLKA